MTLIPIAWARSTQDISSNITGSSAFDFEADGVTEVVYGDECFTRVYNGLTGDVLFSQYRSSCTWYENPLIADVDDFDAARFCPRQDRRDVTAAEREEVRDAVTL